MDFIKNKSPIINGNEVTFTYTGKADTIYIAGDYNQWELEDKMQKLENNDVWYIKNTFPKTHGLITSLL